LFFHLVAGQKEIILVGRGWSVAPFKPLDRLEGTAVPQEKM
jgi:hypothetical protein